MSLLLCGTSNILKRITLFTMSIRPGYIILIPEIENATAENIFLSQNGFFKFENFTSDQCMSAIAKQSLDLEAGIRNIENEIVKKKLKKETPDIFKDVFEPLEVLSSTLDTTWGLAKCMYLGKNALMPATNYLHLHNRAQRARSAKYNSKPIFDLVRASLERPNVSEEHARMLKKFQLEGKLNGLHLSKLDKTKLDICLNKLSREMNEFKTKVDIVTRSYQLEIEITEFIESFPEELQKSIFDYKHGSWLFTLQSKSYMPFMEYCEIRELRCDVWKTMVSRCCPENAKLLSTSKNLTNIRWLRKYHANLLGYNNFADMSMETKMAGSVMHIRDTFQTFAKKCRLYSEFEIKGLARFARTRGFLNDLESWDVPYWRRRVREEMFKYNKDNFRKYFPLPKVLQGMFDLCEKLFKVKIKARSGVSVWDDKMKFFELFEENSAEPVASFYLDPYMRGRNKFVDHINTECMVKMQSRSDIVGIKPSASLIFNFHPSTDGKPSLLSFEEVTLLFNKFGHCLQHLLTKANYSEVSGVSNIEWDALEVCGHVFAHFLFNKKVLDSISCHYESGEKLPNDMFKILLKVKDHLKAYDLSEELYLSMLDLELHSTDTFWFDTVARLWAQYRRCKLHEEDSHPCSFIKIFADEWAASYYSPLWARMVAADVYSAFEEAEDSHQAIEPIGERFKETYLTLGGSCHPSEVFKKFRGREPSPKALFKFIHYI